MQTCTLLAEVSVYLSYNCRADLHLTKLNTGIILHTTPEENAPLL
jgi:hypothetical protein